MKLATEMKQKQLKEKVTEEKKKKKHTRNLIKENKTCAHPLP